jgi:crotonobetaine/carnitine-CoA ligase
MLEAQAIRRPEQIYAVFGDGRSWSFAETLRQTRIIACGLQALGVAQDDTVLIALPNGPEALRVWFAVNYIGAVAVHVNLAYRGTLLSRVACNAQARLVLADGEFLSRLEGIDRGRLERAVLFGAMGEALTTLSVTQAADLDTHGDTPALPGRPILPFDLQCIIYTSGTTGPSKGVMCSYQHIYTAGRAVYFMTEDDRYMVNLPMYHVAGILPCVLMLGLGGSVALIERFRAAEFWQTVADTKPTFVILLSVMMGYLLALEPCAAERGSTIRKIIAQPLDNDALRLRARFGFDVYTSFNMTEISIPIISEPNPTALGSCGRLRAGVEARIVDAYDCEVPTGEAGELILRTDQPWAMTHGYFGDGDATARAWRNGWFHTGDAFRRDACGTYTFVDRMKDTIRRRGENISSFEVEAETLAHPAIREAAAVAVAHALSESDVMVVVSLLPDAEFDPAELIAFLRPRLPYFMIPRYVRVVAELPKTPTQKIEKHVLRAEGLAGDVWDREAAGISVRRDDPPRRVSR